MSDLDDNKAGQALTPVAVTQENFTGYRDQIDMAQLMAKAQVLPKHLHGNPGNCLAVITISHSWNLNPILVGLKTSVIPRSGGGETLMFEGQLVNAAINKSGLLAERLKFDLSGMGDKTTCTIRGRLKGEQEERTVTIGMPKTQNSPLWKGNQGNIEQQMTYLGARTWCRRHLPEVLLGVYTPEDDWTEREPDAVSERREAVAGRVAALENQRSIQPDIGQRDDFIDIKVSGAGMPEGASLRTTPEKIKTASEILQHTEKATIGADKTVGPLESLLDEPIPEFTRGAGPEKWSEAAPVKCYTCGDRGVVDDETGKGPCPDCGPQTEGSQNDEEKTKPGR